MSRTTTGEPLPTTGSRTRTRASRSVPPFGRAPRREARRRPYQPTHAAADFSRILVPARAVDLESSNQHEHQPVEEGRHDRSDRSRNTRTKEGDAVSTRGRQDAVLQEPPDPKLARMPTLSATAPLGRLGETEAQDSQSTTRPPSSKTYPFSSPAPELPLMMEFPGTFPAIDLRASPPAVEDTDDPASARQTEPEPIQPAAPLSDYEAFLVAAQAEDRAIRQQVWQAIIEGASAAAASSGHDARPNPHQQYTPSPHGPSCSSGDAAGRMNDGSSQYASSKRRTRRTTKALSTLFSNSKSDWDSYLGSGAENHRGSKYSMVQQVSTHAPRISLNEQGLGHASSAAPRTNERKTGGAGGEQGYISRWESGFKQRIVDYIRLPKDQQLHRLSN
jgi:hypothetical protein